MKLLNRLFPKFSITIILICLVPLATVSVFVSKTASDNLRRETFNHLESIASIQQARMTDIIHAYRDSIALIASRTQLRKDIGHYVTDPDPVLIDNANTILIDARDSIDDIVDISVYNLDGYVIASTEPSMIGSYMMHEKCVTEGEVSSDIRDLILTDDDRVLAHLSGPLVDQGQTVGVVVVDILTTKISNMVSDYSGLQSTGETVVALRNADGDAVFIHPLRFDPEAALTRTEPLENKVIPINQALMKREILINDALDYRGEPVLAVTRYLDSVDWGMVVKIDRAEALAPIYDLRKTLLLVNIAVLLTIILVAIYWARRLSQPITELTRTALDFGRGNLESRSSISSTDEIGALAATFNRMAKNIHGQQETLEVRVKERTEQLQREIEEREQAEQALRLSENNFRLSIEESPLPIIIVDHSLNVVYANQASLRLFGYTSVNEFHRIPIQNRISEDSLLLFQNIVELYTEGFPEPQVREIDLIAKSGEVRHGEVFFKEILWNNQYQLQMIFRDLTEIRKMQEAILSKDRLASLGQLVAGLAHELNNPLTGILGLAELLLTEDMPENLAEDIRMIHTQAQRTAGIVNELVVFSQIHPEQQIPVNINDIIRTVLNLRSVEQRHSNIQLSVQLDPALPSIRGNISQLHQVIYNIVINAEYYMVRKNKGGHLGIVTEVAEGKVRVTISDDGPGIPEGDRSKVFTPFFTTKDVGEGAGLGLSISYGIVKDHHGDIRIESQEGRGTTVIIEFPLYRKPGTEQQ